MEIRISQYLVRPLGCNAAQCDVCSRCNRQSRTRRDPDQRSKSPSRRQKMERLVGKCRSRSDSSEIEQLPAILPRQLTIAAIEAPVVGINVSTIGAARIRLIVCE